ncbi:hypothetical protein RRG08_030421 [Elysia crispata]|uniref:Uncharacterized protein n=1 Tax=Elysia crispata TaxID=231223 RepID=A0AAE0YGF1_9GAST|nr:hypothetical protein RRG08_030421 [Elysia crispata]
MVTRCCQGSSQITKQGNGAGLSFYHDDAKETSPVENFSQAARCLSNRKNVCTSSGSLEREIISLFGLSDGSFRKSQATSTNLWWEKNQRGKAHDVVRLPKTPGRKREAPSKTQSVDVVVNCPVRPVTPEKENTGPELLQADCIVRRNLRSRVADGLTITSQTAAATSSITTTTSSAISPTLTPSTSHTTITAAQISTALVKGSDSMS